MKKLLIYYSFTLIAIMTIIGFLSTTNYAHLVSAVLFFPLFLYLLKIVFPRRKKALIIPIKITPKKTSSIALPEETGKPTKLKRRLDVDKRMFIKLIGSAGISMFLLAIFTKKAHGAFFGSVPGPGTVAIKDTSGAQIDPAQHHPTDGYKISELDDSVPAYYGFINKDDAWFIMKEGSGGDYRYAKGSSDFTNVTTGWPNRASLSYDYFNVVF